MNNVLSYSLKVWFFAVIIGVIAIYAISYFEIGILIFGKETEALVLKRNFLSCIAMIIASAPFFIIFYLLNDFLYEKLNSLLRFKLLINFISIFLISVPANLLYYLPNVKYILFPILLTLGIWIFQINHVTSNSEILDDIDFKK